MDELARNAIRDVIVEHNSNHSGYGYGDDEIKKMIEAVRSVDNPDSAYSITVNIRDADGVFDVAEYGMTYSAFEVAKAAAQRRVNSTPWALCGHVRLVAPSGATFKVGAVWPEEKRPDSTDSRG